MKITNSLLQTIGLALMIPCMTTSCTSKDINTAQRQAKTHDTLVFPGIADTLNTDTLLMENSGDNCPACGRG